MERRVQRHPGGASVRFMGGIGSGMTMATVAVVAIGFMVWLPRPAIPLIDGDVWWHLRAGEEVLSSGRIPTADTWSIVGSGMAWTSQDWLSNVLMAVIHGAGVYGPTLLSVVFALFIVLSLVVLWFGVGMRSPQSGWLSRLVWLTIGLTVAGPVVGVRVQVVDLPLAVAALVVCWHYVASRRRLVLIWLPVIAIAWANLHAGWLLLFLLTGAVIVGEVLDRVVRRGTVPAPLRWTEVGWLTAAAVAALAAIGVNPNGIRLYLYPIETASIAAHRDFLAEWSPPDLGMLPGQLFAAFVVLGVLPALVFGWRRMRMADILVLIGLSVMAGTAARFLLVAGPIGAAIVAFALGPILAQMPVGRAAGPILSRMAQAPRTRLAATLNVTLAFVLASIGIAVTAVRIAPPAQRAAIDEHMPTGAVDWMLVNDPGERPFNTYAWGGYLGYARPEVPVYIDGRSDIYGDAPIREYADAISLRSDPGELLERHDIDHVLFNAIHPFAEWLDAQPAWERAYTDRMASVWVKVRDAGD